MSYTFTGRQIASSIATLLVAASSMTLLHTVASQNVKNSHDDKPYVNALIEAPFVIAYTVISGLFIVSVYIVGGLAVITFIAIPTGVVFRIFASKK